MNSHIEKIKVNIVTPWNRKCGIADYSKNLVKSLNNLPLDVRIIYNDQPTSMNPFYWIRLALKSRKDCDVIHIQHEYSLFGKFWKIIGIMSFIFYNFLTIKKHYKIITTIHEIPERSYDGNLLKRLIKKIYYFLADYFIKCSDVVIVHTEYAKRKIIEKFETVNVVVISHGCFVDVLIMDKNSSKNKLGWAGKHVLTIFGFINRRKNYEDIISVLPRLHKNIILVIAGGTRSHSDELYLIQLKKLIKDVSVENRVFFTGYLKNEEIPKIFSASDIILLPYKT